MVKKLPKIISQEEFEKLYLEVAKRIKKTKSKKNKLRLKKYLLSILLGFESGLRISEVIGYKHIPPLTRSRVENKFLIIIQGKGKRDRIVPRPKRMNNKSLDLLPIDLNYRSLQHFITKLGSDVLKKDISFHTLRHGFLSHLANSGRPLHEIQMLAGHSRLDTTGIYLHANPKKAIEEARDVF